MRLIVELLPIIIFFAVYKLDGIYSATAVLILAISTQVAYQWVKHRHVPTMMKITLVLVILFGGATLLLEDPMFIKWKPTILQWILSVGFLLSMFIGKRTLVERLLDAQVTLPKPQWRHLNIAWTLFLLFSGTLNLYVAYQFDEATWVNFKLFGLMGLTILFIIGQAVYMSRYMVEEDQPEAQEEAASDDTEATEQSATAQQPVIQKLRE
uniref:Inner membrane-spanning protein YciB n=1 Tax=Magnetococcus massalia (strain MO-1) TaxID=451514 RepID=A0A1S7LK81_MAGMO|nr:Intracellular septation protein A [Candidatus Magnetococcus massalia]